jgi:hypothetical protein
VNRTLRISAWTSQWGGACDYKGRLGNDPARFAESLVKAQMLNDFGLFGRSGGKFTHRRPGPRPSPSWAASTLARGRYYVFSGSPGRRALTALCEAWRGARERIREIGADQGEIMAASQLHGAPHESLSWYWQVPQNR